MALDVRFRDHATDGRPPEMGRMQTCRIHSETGPKTTPLRSALTNWGDTGTDRGSEAAVPERASTMPRDGGKRRALLQQRAAANRTESTTDP